MKIADVTVGMRIDNYGYPRKLLVITKVAEWSGGGNGDISFEEHSHGHKRLRQMTFKQFERLAFIRPAT